MDFMKSAREYGVPLDILPESFRTAVAKYSRAKDGVWRTFAYDALQAQKQITEVVRICSEDKSFRLMVVPEMLSAPKRSKAVKFKREAEAEG